MNRTIAEGAVILAPHGRDAAVAEAMLREAGLEAAAFPDIPSFVRALRGGAGFAIVTEEALRGADLRDLAGFLGDQAEWSDFPFIVLTSHATSVAVKLGRGSVNTVEVLQGLSVGDSVIISDMSLWENVSRVKLRR